jgi:hypothetical protein
MSSQPTPFAQQILQDAIQQASHLSTFMRTKTYTDEFEIMKTGCDSELIRRLHYDINQIINTIIQILDTYLLPPIQLIASVMCVMHLQDQLSAQMRELGLSQQVDQYVPQSHAGNPEASNCEEEERWVHIFGSFLKDTIFLGKSTVSFTYFANMLQFHTMNITNQNEERPTRCFTPGDLLFFHERFCNRPTIMTQVYKITCI